MEAGLSIRLNPQGGNQLNVRELLRLVCPPPESDAEDADDADMEDGAGVGSAAEHTEIEPPARRNVLDEYDYDDDFIDDGELLEETDEESSEADDDYDPDDEVPGTPPQPSDEEDFDQETPSNQPTPSIHKQIPNTNRTFHHGFGNFYVNSGDLPPKKDVAAPQPPTKVGNVQLEFLPPWVKQPIPQELCSIVRNLPPNVQVASNLSPNREKEKDKEKEKEISSQPSNDNDETLKNQRKSIQPESSTPKNQTPSKSNKPPHPDKQVTAPTNNKPTSQKPPLSSTPNAKGTTTNTSAKPSASGVQPHPPSHSPTTTKNTTPKSSNTSNPKQVSDSAISKELSSSSKPSNTNQPTVVTPPKNSASQNSSGLAVSATPVHSLNSTQSQPSSGTNRPSLGKITKPIPSDVIAEIDKLARLCQEQFEDKKPKLNDPGVQDQLHVIFRTAIAAGAARLHSDIAKDRRVVALADDIWVRLNRFLRTKRANLEALGHALLWSAKEKIAITRVNNIELNIEKEMGKRKGAFENGAVLTVQWSDELDHMLFDWYEAKCDLQEAKNQLGSRVKSVKKSVGGWVAALKKQAFHGWSVSENELMESFRRVESRKNAEERQRREQERQERKRKREEHQAAMAAKRAHMEKLKAEKASANTNTNQSTPGRSNNQAESGNNNKTNPSATPPSSGAIIKNISSSTTSKPPSDMSRSTQPTKATPKASTVRPKPVTPGPKPTLVKPVPHTTSSTKTSAGQHGKGPRARGAASRISAKSTQVSKSTPPNKSTPANKSTTGSKSTNNNSSSARGNNSSLPRNGSNPQGKGKSSTPGRSTGGSGNTNRTNNNNASLPSKAHASNRSNNATKASSTGKMNAGVLSHHSKNDKSNQTFTKTQGNRDSTSQHKEVLAIRNIASGTKSSGGDVHRLDRSSKPSNNVVSQQNTATVPVHRRRQISPLYADAVHPPTRIVGVSQNNAIINSQPASIMNATQMGMISPQRSGISTPRHGNIVMNPQTEVMSSRPSAINPIPTMQPQILPSMPSQPKQWIPANILPSPPTGLSASLYANPVSRQQHLAMRQAVTQSTPQSHILNTPHNRQHNTSANVQVSALPPVGHSGNPSVLQHHSSSVGDQNQSHGRNENRTKSGGQQGFEVIELD